MDFMQWLLTAQIPVAGSALLVREVIGNAFGLASALGGMTRRVWAWPAGIVGNLILLTVFAGAAVGLAPESGVGSVALYGQAGRQIMFVAVSAYGWVQWHRAGRGFFVWWRAQRASAALRTAAPAGAERADTPVVAA